MNVTFLVGNGFDIACGVNSSYYAFYKWYCDMNSDIEHIRDFRKNIKDDIDNDGENWSDFELGLGQYTKHFTVDDVDKFFECYEDAHGMIIKYLKEQLSKIDTENIPEEEITAFSNGILNFYQELFPQERQVFDEIFKKDKSSNTTINFLSFNYTNILNIVIGHIAKRPLKEWVYFSDKMSIKVNPNVLHMHGTADKYPILGVDNASQIANQELLKVPNFSEIMIKSQSVNAIGQLWHSSAESVIANSRIICIFGMSIGESDTKWWKKVLEWLIDSTSHQLILYWYSKEPSDGISIYKVLEQKRKAKQAIYNYLDISREDIDKIDDRIHVIINTDNVLRIKLNTRN